jgi:hypothetical protein
MNKKTIILIIIIIIVVGAGVLWCASNYIKPSIVDNGKNNEVGEIDTSGWQTYKNEEYGFEVKYPEGWTAEKKEKIKMGTSTDYVIIINPENNSYLNIEKAYSEEVSFNNTTFQQLDNIYISGQKTYTAYLEESLSVYYKYFVKMNKESYFIYFVPKNNDKDIFYEIIKTIRFK